MGPVQRRSVGPVLVADIGTTLVDLGIPSIVGGLVGVGIGWGLSEKSAAKQRRLDDARLAQQRKDRLTDAAAAELDSLLASMDHELIPLRSQVQPMSPSLVLAAGATWQATWSRCRYQIADAELNERLESVDTFMTWVRLAADDEGNVPNLDLTFQYQAAFFNGRSAIAAWRAGIELPPRCFPNRADWHEMDHYFVVYESRWTVLARWIDEHTDLHPLLQLMATVRYAFIDSRGLEPLDPPGPATGCLGAPE